MTTKATSIHIVMAGPVVVQAYRAEEDAQRFVDLLTAAGLREASVKTVDLVAASRKITPKPKAVKAA